MLDMTTVERNALDALEAEKAKVGRLEKELETAKQENAKLHEKNKEQNDTILDLMTDLANEKQHYKEVYDDREASLDLWQQATAERDIYKQVTKWLIKQIGGGKRG